MYVFGYVETQWLVVLLVISRYHVCVFVYGETQWLVVLLVISRHREYLGLLKQGSWWFFW